jgi:hypothetical protein
VVQAMEKDGGSSFKCADSSAWRKDCLCGTTSDFMTAGAKHGQIPAVPKGFVRVMKLGKINERRLNLLSGRAPSTSATPDGRLKAADDRWAQYIYCGDATTVPDTSDWTPLCVDFAAKMKLKKVGGAQRIYSLRPQPAQITKQASNANHSVEELLQQHPWLKLTLDDFSFTRSLQVLVPVVDPTYTVSELQDMPIPTMKRHFETVR